MQRAVRFLAENQSFSLISVFIILMIAWVQLPKLKIAQYPTVEMPTLTINVTLPGASPSELEQRVINEVEERLENLRRVDRFRSFVSNSYGRIDIQYEYGVDIEEEYVEVNTQINNLITELPVATEIMVLKQSPLDRMVSFVVAINSDVATGLERVRVAERLKQRLRRIVNLENVVVTKPDKEVRIELDLVRMVRHGIAIGQVQQAIVGNNQFLPTGFMKFGNKAVAVKAFTGGYQSLDELANTMVNTATGAALPLREFATVSLVPSDNQVIYRVNGINSTWVTMKLGKDANVYDIRAQLEEILVEEREQLGGDMELMLLFDVAEGVEHKLDELIGNLTTGILILVIVLLFCVGYRSAFIIAMMLPAALFMSLVGLTLTDYGVQEISLAGFIISLGLIVDNGIVVTENAYKLQTYGGHSRREAAITGTASVVYPLLSSTLTTALAFAPVFLMTSVTGLFLHSMVATIWLCLATSLFAAVVFLTLYLSRVGTDNRLPLLPPFPNLLIALKPFRDERYAALVRFLIQRPLPLVVVVIALFALTVFAATGFRIIIFPNADDPYFTVNIEMSDDRSNDFVDEIAREVTETLLQREEIVTCATSVGHTLPFVHTGMLQMRNSPQNVHILCRTNFRDAAGVGRLVDAVNRDLSIYEPFGSFRAAQFVIGEGAYDFDIEIDVSGARIQDVSATANRIEDIIRRANIDGIALINNPGRSRWFSLNVEFKEQIATDLGITRAQVDQILVLLTKGQEIDYYRGAPEDEYPIVLRTEVDFEEPMAVFDRIFLTSSLQQLVPLSHVVDVSFTEAQTDILHENYKPFVSVGINAEPGFGVAELTQRVYGTLDGLETPGDVQIDLGGTLAKSTGAFGGVGKYGVIIGLTILAIFVIQFRSFLQPAIILATIPLSFIGGLILLRLTGQPLSFTAFVGLTSLMGIVVNNAILLIDEGNRLRAAEPALPLADIAVAAGVSRFMPILLTSVTSICGLLPLALGESLFKPLATVVIGGLATSTFLTLLCVPVLYAYLTRDSQQTVQNSG